jgi:hypothetical protein
MARGRTITIATALLLASTGVSVLAQQGALAGKATAEAQQPYTENYRVQLRDPASGAIVGTPQALDAQGRFSFTSLETNRRYLVELFLVKENRVVCTEGPFQLTTTRVSLTDIDIDCGKKPLALWLLAAGAGTAAVIAIATRSASQ